jgi:hypothetical protein
LTFTITNAAKEDVWIDPHGEMGGIATIDWQNLDTQENKYKLVPDETKEVTGLLFILPTTPIGTYELVFDFVNQYGVNQTVSIDITVIEWTGDDDDTSNGGIDPGLMLAFLIVGIVVLMIAIAAVYFLVLKKKKTGPKASEEQLARIEKELMEEGSGDRSLATAPQPKGLGKTVGGPLPKEGDDIPEMEDWDEADVQEEIKLVEDGAEDDWMNLVASETVAAESESDIVEDKTVDSDHTKSLADLLAEMSGDIEDEEEP